MLETELTKQAAEIAAAGHAGWGNTMLDAAAELAALRKDAERYRWLRANTHGEQDGRGRQEFCMPDPCPRANIMRGSVAQHLDAAIDGDMLEAEAVRKAVGAA